MLKKIADGIWASPSDKTAFSHDIGTRTVLIDTGDGLFAHSPREELAQEIKQLGEIKYVALANKWRKNHAARIHQLFPQARFFGAPDLEKTEKNLPLEIISDGGQYPWSAMIDHMLIRGSPFFNEVAFFHKPSATLILADHGGYMYDGGPIATQLAMKLLKIGSRIGWTEQERKLYIRDREAFAQSIEKMLQWNFKRVLVAHGPILEPMEPARLREALL